MTKKYEDLIGEESEDSFIAFSSENGRLEMTVIGEPDNVNTITAHQCVSVFSLWLEKLGVVNENEDIRFMTTKGRA